MTLRINPRRYGWRSKDSEGAWVCRTTDIPYERGTPDGVAPHYVQFPITWNSRSQPKCLGQAQSREGGTVQAGSWEQMADGGTTAGWEMHLLGRRPASPGQVGTAYRKGAVGRRPQDGTLPDLLHLLKHLAWRRYGLFNLATFSGLSGI